MKKEEFARLAMIGISAGLIVGGCQQKPEGPAGGGKQGGGAGANLQQMSSDMQTFYSSLTPETQKKFMQLDAKHKMMVLEMMTQTGKGDNKCQGLGGCKTTEHDCAGLNDCKGKGGPAIKDPNHAVDIQYRNQTEQRQKANKGLDDTKTAPNGAPAQKGPSSNSGAGSSYGGSHH